MISFLQFVRKPQVGARFLLDIPYGADPDKRDTAMAEKRAFLFESPSGALKS